MTNKTEALKDARELIEYAKSLGMTELPASKATEETTGDNKSKPEKSVRTNDMTAKEKAGALEKLVKKIGDCKRCGLCDGRTNLVFGTGSPNADLMFIGEGPGRDEDAQGLPFVGRSGKLLTDIIKAMGLTRDDVYIANIVKCRPPKNRNPQPDEVKTCIPFLINQAEIIAPKVIVCLGSVATQNLLGTEEKISKMRGKFTEWSDIPVMPTYHPAFLLRNSNMKKPVWEDMQLVMKKMGIKPPKTPK
jgi:uracil-DNA glycosylase